ncbi:ARM repeat-containing protein [Dendrothele bispora CBS 962.96]|uniref:ARM repeat-containing protein n=1 Tax=Dendrothele bispora (strain CBS 962.96) TaxID=1314807 RepID=A0A4S8MY87_DENBC|nr:ARM repeat-containing protein [Dendrothele bispora CBS 962.96]
MANISELLSALDVFTRTPDKASLEKANTWLQDFQHSPEAWSTCNVLLLSPDVPPAAKLFAAQTFRTKVTYDLSQVDPSNIAGLRDTLVAALQKYSAGPRTIIVQLCLAISGLALQFPAWENAVQTMINTFGVNPATVPVLLQFLTLLPEEVHTNNRIPITDYEWRERVSDLLAANSKQVLDLLSMYIQASGVTADVQNQAFKCLRSWLMSGEVSTLEMAESPLLAFSFEALASENLFDAAVDVICELIHETQEIDDNMPVIEVIVPRVIALKPLLTTQRDDSDRIRGYARIFAEAGETYRVLIIQHTETFFPIVEAIGECSAYPDLDIVPITFPFWERLAQVIGKRTSVSPLFQQAYRSVMQVIINHLKFPPDATPLVGQEADDFRAFRHVMGDTLKDCCEVLETESCLLATYEMIATALSQSSSWQEVEAPLFAMRSIGGRIDLNDEVAVPKIMDLIPSLPNHPRVRYAATLIISRYTEWISKHPAYIPVQLQYISAGFEDTDMDVVAAAGQALKYLCQDCKEHLVDVLPTLHTFLNTTGSRLCQEDKVQIYEAIAFVISAMPMEKAAESLRTFSLDLLAVVHNVATSPTTANDGDLTTICNALESLEVMLSVIGSFGEELPAACQNTCNEVWAMFDALLSKYCKDENVAERSCRVVRYGLSFFDEAVLPVAPSVVARMSFSFEASGVASFLWIAGKIIGRFGDRENPDLRGSFKEIYERSTQKLVQLLQTQSPDTIPGVLEDYVQMLIQMLQQTPDILFQSSVFPLAFRAATATLNLVQADPVFAALDFFLSIFTHDCLEPVNNLPPNFTQYARAIQTAFEASGPDFLGYLLTGLVGNFPPESDPLVVSIFRSITAMWPTQVMAWLPTILQQIPSSSAPNEIKTTFLSDVSTAINNKKFDKVKYAVITLHRASRRIRERRRTGALVP